MINPSSQTCLTRIAFYRQPDRINQYLRFGEPVKEYSFGRYRSVYYFLPTSVAGFIHWKANDYGTIDWRLYGIQTGYHGDKLQKLPGVKPDAHLLLVATGEPQVRQVFEVIDSIEAQGINPADVSPQYFRHCHTRIQARQAFHAYSQAQHLAWLAGKALL